MTVVASPGTVLVTGANGYIAVWICKILLEQGYSVRGTIRSDSKAPHLERLFESYGDKFECAVVADISKEGAFDEAVKGVSGVLHTASPVTFDVKDPDELIKPAVEGTLSVMNSILKFGSDVQRMVLTSSVAAIAEPHEPGYVYSEEDWNETSIRETKEKGEDAWSHHKHRASKTLAEKAAWDFVAEHKASIKWDLVTLLPPFVFGPLLQETSAKEPLNFSPGLVYEAIVQEKPLEELYGGAGNWVDVRDVALAHVLALQKEDAGGERIIVSSGAFAWQDLYDGLNAMPHPLADIPRGNPSPERGRMEIYNTDKVKRLLGIKFRSLGESGYDTIVSARQRIADIGAL